MFVSREARPLRDRLLLRLLDLVDSNAASNLARLRRDPVSQSTFAGMTGVNRQNVNRALGGLILDCCDSPMAAATSSSTWTGLGPRVTRDRPVMPVRDRRSDPTVP